MNKFTQVFFEADGAGGGGEPAHSGDPLLFLINTNLSFRMGLSLRRN